MSERDLITDEDLHAFIDGELDAARADVIRLRCAADAILAERVANFRADKDRLAAVYGPLAERPLPEAWVQTLEQAKWRGQRRAPVVTTRRALFAAAASIAVVIAGGSAYRFLTVGDEAIVADALAALTAEAETVASPATADATLQAVVGGTVKAPELSRMGYALTDVGVYPVPAGGAAVKLGYRNSAGRQFALYIRRSDGSAIFDMTRKDAIRICVWQDDVVAAVMLGEMSAAEMLRLATLAYGGLNTKA